MCTGMCVVMCSVRTLEGCAQCDLTFLAYGDDRYIHLEYIGHAAIVHDVGHIGTTAIVCVGYILKAMQRVVGHLH